MTGRPVLRLSVVGALGGAWQRDGWTMRLLVATVTNFKSKETFLSGHQGEWAADDAFYPTATVPHDG